MSRLLESYRMHHKRFTLVVGESNALAVEGSLPAHKATGTHPSKPAAGLRIDHIPNITRALGNGK